MAFSERAQPSAAPQRVVTLEGAASGTPVHLASAEQVAEREARENEVAQPIASAPAPPQAETTTSTATPEVPDEAEPAEEPHRLEGTRAEDGTTFRTPPVRGGTTEAATTSEAPIPEPAVTVPKVLGTPVQASDPPEPEPVPSGQAIPKGGAASGAPLPTSPKTPGVSQPPPGYIGLLNVPNNPKAVPQPKGFNPPPGDLAAIAKARQTAEAAKAQQIAHKGNTYWIQAPKNSTPEQIARELEVARTRVYESEMPDEFNSPPKLAPSAPSNNLARPHNDRPRNDSVDRNLAYQRAEEERVIQEW